MLIIRPDARERFAELKTLVVMVRDAKATEIREQHLQRMERILDMMETSLEEPIDRNADE